MDTTRNVRAEASLPLHLNQHLQLAAIPAADEEADRQPSYDGCRCTERANASRSALSRSLCVDGSPCEAPS